MLSVPSDGNKISWTPWLYATPKLHIAREDLSLKNRCAYNNITWFSIQ
jgi:hypothetical protein